MIIGFVFTAIIVTICIRFFDKMLAVYISRLSFNGSIWHRLTSDIPDTLLVMVCGITAVAAACYLTRRKKGIYDSNTTFFHHLMYVMPASYVVKTLFKFVFGRINTREWLMHPGSYGFHWFGGVRPYDGFPSGHMVVFTALAATLWRFYPRYRVTYSVLTIVLALLLIATDYHFLSDVIAGAYLGIIAEVCANEMLCRGEQPG